MLPAYNYFHPVKFSRIFLRLFTGLTIFLLHLSAFAQGPIDGYLKGKKVLDIALSYTYSTSDNYNDGEGNELDLEYKAHMASLFAEYGISNRIDAVLTLPYVVGQGEHNFQDMGLFVKYRPFYKPVMEKYKLGFILSTGYSFPVSNYQPDVTGALGQRAKVIPLKAIAQMEFDKGIFVNFTGAYHVRLDKVSEETIEDVQATNSGFTETKPGNYATIMLKGGMAMQYSYFDLFAEYQKSFGGVDYEDSVVKPSQLYAVDYLKIGGVFYYAMDDHAGIALNASYIPYGRNIGNIFSISASLIVKVNMTRKNKRGGTL